MSSGEGGDEMTPCSINMSKVAPKKNEDLYRGLNVVVLWL